MIGKTNAITITSDGGTLPPTTGDYKVTFIDPFGVISEQWVNDGEDAVVPTPSVYDNLTFTEWNQDTTNITSDKVIGATYNTVEGYTYAFLKVTKLTGKTLDMHFLTNSGTITIDWGDGVEETADADGTVTDGYKKKHDYEDYGEYVVKIIYSGDSTFTLGYNDMQHFFVGKVDMTTESFSKDMAMLTKLYVGSYTGSAAPMIIMYANLKGIVLPNDFTTVCDYFMLGCYSLKVAPSLNSVTTVGDYFMESCMSLEVAPSLNSVTTVGDYFMNYCYSLKVAPSLNSVTTVGDYFMNYCYSLKVAPSLNSVTTVGDYFMNYCYSLKSFTINQYITSLNSYFLYGSNNTMKIICEGSTPPTLMSVSIQPLNGYFAIYVPDTAVDTYKEATNWSYYADYIYPMSDIGE